jgi:hypothetical protein
MAKPECANFTANAKSCPCTYEPCEKKGFCCQCMNYHRRNGELPACYFTPEVEKTYDRSIARFVATRKK